MRTSILEPQQLGELTLKHSLLGQQKPSAYGISPSHLVPPAAITAQVAFVSFGFAVRRIDSVAPFAGSRSRSRNHLECWRGWRREQSAAVLLAFGIHQAHIFKWQKSWIRHLPWNRLFPFLREMLFLRGRKGAGTGGFPFCFSWVGGCYWSAIGEKWAGGLAIFLQPCSVGFGGSGCRHSAGVFCAGTEAGESELGYWQVFLLFWAVEMERMRQAI